MRLEWMLAGVLVAGVASGQTVKGGAAPETATTAKVVDADVEVAEGMIGRALFLRGFYAANELSYDASGKVEGAPKVTDWTVAAMDVLKAERKAPGQIELEGVRVAIRYNQDAHVFERHQQKDEKMKVLVADTGDPKRTASALGEVFATGIDPRMQQEMPQYWVHYFNPGAPWTPDPLAGKVIVGTNGHPFPAGGTQAVPEKKVEPKFTAFAQRDRLKGTLQMRMAVDEQGAPGRVAVLVPLGYGMEGRMVEALDQWRFHPATVQGKPVASAVVINQTFDVVNPPAF